jgi:hypothetical protein
MSSWSPATCSHCGNEIFPAKYAPEMGWPHEHAPTGWVHNADMVDVHNSWDNEGKRMTEHSGHPADNRSVEQEEHGGKDLFQKVTTHHEFNKIIKNNNLGKQF